MNERYDVVAVGGGNAAFSAAHAAAEHARRVVVLEKAPEEWSGGNSFFTAGAFRTTHDSLEAVRPLLHEQLPGDVAEVTDLPAYRDEHFVEDMRRLTRRRCDPELTGILVEDSFDTVRWLADKGVRWRLMYDRQSFLQDGVHRFWGGLSLGTVDGGKGLMADHLAAARGADVELRYDSPVLRLRTGPDGAVTGVVVGGPEGPYEVDAGSVVLACGGFEADPRLRATYLGPGWDLASVRGTPYNTGDGLEMAFAVGAQSFGHFSGCHSVAWDAAAPAARGDRELTNLFTKQSYPLGIVVNAEARRFIDEGEDYRNYTYAKYGAAIMRQPGAIAYQLFDAKTRPLLRENEYTHAGVSASQAPSVRELAERIGIDPDALEATVEEFNAAVQPGEFSPAVKDGKRTVGIALPKSNWAQPLDTPPFYGFAVTCGITFTFGGLRVDAHARVLDRGGRAIPGLLAAGELVGGLFFHNYPGGTGLMAGSVFGRRAGHTAAKA